ncbi:hypothetical protein TNCV_4548001 [Trichonephila clavipes]|nr:hypothetical protein TNCV_4548001 [Trichonephila clavipes]
MKERKVWDLVDHPDNIKILENRWVYTIKYDENNKIVRYKARLVARGNTQLRAGMKMDGDCKGNLQTEQLLNLEAGASLFTDPIFDVRQMHMNVVKCSN